MPRRHKASGSGSANFRSCSLYETVYDKYDNRLFGCLAISPAGRALNDFTSISELLTALRDAIKAHRSLYSVGNILHRDISENNIIITDPSHANGFTGMLIDLDLAKHVGSHRSGARHRTGTMEFMAIEVLWKHAHTFRHDLESFFYILVWICGRRAWEREFLCDPKERPVIDILKGYIGTFYEIGLAKHGHMHAGGFISILRQFPPSFACVKPLCIRLRRVLFPMRTDGETLNTGTPPEASLLYDAVLKEFDEAISTIAGNKGRD